MKAIITEEAKKIQEFNGYKRTAMHNVIHNYLNRGKSGMDPRFTNLTPGYAELCDNPPCVNMHNRMELHKTHNLEMDIVMDPQFGTTKYDAAMRPFTVVIDKNGVGELIRFTREDVESEEFTKFLHMVEDYHEEIHKRYGIKVEIFHNEMGDLQEVVDFEDYMRSNVIDPENPEFKFLQDEYHVLTFICHNLFYDMFLLAGVADSFVVNPKQKAEELFDGYKNNTFWHIVKIIK